MSVLMLQNNMSEFIDPYSLPEDHEQRVLHLQRYEWAAKHITGKVVANAACSTNYGWDILKVPGRLVIGFDRNLKAFEIANANRKLHYIRKDIQGENFDGFDALVCLETFEHLKEPTRFLDGLSNTVKEIILSVPIIPTKHFNPFHLHDFTEEQVVELLKKNRWQIKEIMHQDEAGLDKPTYAVIYATR